MKIKIFKNKDKVVFSYEKENLEFNYENINKFIEKRLEDLGDSMQFESQDELEDYQKLLTDINKEISKDDFLKAVKAVENKEQELDKQKKELVD